MHVIFWERCLKSMKYIQNRTNWCWVEACKDAGEQYKKNFADAWQSAIARNADFLHGGLEGDFPGNDQMKMRGLKYVVLGDCESNLIQTITLWVTTSTSLLKSHTGATQALTGARESWVVCQKSKFVHYYLFLSVLVFWHKANSACF